MSACISACICPCRKELAEFLQSSSLYRVQLLLGKIQHTDLYAECAILYGKV